MAKDDQLPAVRKDVASPEGLEKLYAALERFISQIPRTEQEPAADPAPRARQIISAAAARAAVVSGGLALPPGPLGLMTVLPDLLAIWRLQAQMVADVAGVFGHAATLSREQMLYCLFKHAAAQLVRDLLVRVGERVLVRRLSGEALRELLQKIGIRITERLVGKAVSRWLPLVGAVGAGAYAYYDTAQVGKTAMELFQKLKKEGEYE